MVHLREHQKRHLLRILERVNSCPGADRDLDAAICVAAGYGLPEPQGGHASLRMPNQYDHAALGHYWLSQPSGETLLRAPELTGDREAVLSFAETVLPQWGHDLYWNNCQGHLGRVEDNANSYEGSSGEEFEATGATGGLAMVGAVLKAMIWRCENDG